MLNLAGVIVGLAVIALGCLMWAAKERREKHDASVKYASTIVELEEQLQHIKKGRSAQVRYVTIDSFSDEQIDYVRTIAQVSDMPEVRFFLHALSMMAHKHLTNDNSDLEAKRRWAYYIEAYAALQDALGVYKRRYNAMTTEQEPEEEDAEISLS